MAPVRARQDNPRTQGHALQIVVTHADRPETQAAIERLSEAVLRIPGLTGPPSTRLSVDRTVALVSYTMAGNQNDLANRAIVRQVRAETVPAALAGLPDVRAYVTGAAARIVDTTAFYENGMVQVLAFVLGLSFLLLLVAFHSVVIPIKAILLNLLSTGAAFGVLVLVFQEGFLREVFHVQPGVIENFVPVFIFTILFGLSMDYHVFILTRIKEARDRGMSLDRGRRAGHLDHVGHDHERRGDHGRRLRGVRDAPAGRDQADRTGPGRGGLRRRDDRPLGAPAGDDAPARRLELVDAAVPLVDPARHDRGRARGGRARRRATGRGRRRPRATAAARARSLPAPDEGDFAPAAPAGRRRSSAGTCGARPRLRGNATAAGSAPRG